MPAPAALPINMHWALLQCDNLLCDLRDPLRPIIKIGDLGLSKVRGAACFQPGTALGPLRASAKAGMVAVLMVMLIVMFS